MNYTKCSLLNFFPLINGLTNGAGEYAHHLYYVVRICFCFNLTIQSTDTI